MKKGLVLGVILLFIGASVTTGFCSNNEKIMTFSISNYNEIKNCHVAPCEEEWNKTYGGTSDDKGSSVLQTSEGGYIIAGITSSYGAGNNDGWLIKTDGNGNELWNRTYGGTNNDYWDSDSLIQQTSEGGYIIAGATHSFGAGNRDGWLIKTDSIGNEIWSKTFGGTDWDRFHSVQLTSDGGYIIVGHTFSYGAGHVDGWLVKTDSNGNEVWSKTFGGSGEDRFYSVQQTSDDGYIIAGHTHSYGSGISDAWLIKTDSNGNEVWSKTFGGTNRDRFISVQLTSDGRYIIIGHTSSYGAGDWDAWLIKTDSNGNELLNKTNGGTGEDRIWSAQHTSDNGYIIAGHTNSYGTGNRDGWVIKTDSNGNEVWSKTFGEIDEDWFISIKQTSDNGYIITGSTWSYGAGLSDVWLIKLYPDIIPEVVYVDDDFDENIPGWGYDHFDSIQDGINAVNVSGTVYVYNGTYYENAVVDKTVNLIGEDRNTTIIDAGGSGDVTYVSADLVSISGFTFQNSGSYWSHNFPDAGLEIRANYVKIHNNIFKNNGRYGLYLRNSNYCDVYENTVINNNDDGIYLHYSAGNKVNNNLVINGKVTGRAGISMKEPASTDNEFYNNVITNNYFGVVIAVSANNNKIYHNNFFGNNINARDYSRNIWDNGYPSGGNYWDDYTGIDNFHGPNQDIPGSDDIGDTPYPIPSGNNQDNYPFIRSLFVYLVNIDIKPGSYPNSVNPKSNGKLPVAILTTEDFNASKVVSESIDFLSASPLMYAIEDVDDDGDEDMLLHFKIKDLDFSLLVDEGGEYPYAYLYGETFYGLLLEGKDTVRLVQPWQFWFEQIYQRYMEFLEWLRQFF